MTTIQYTSTEIRTQLQSLPGDWMVRGLDLIDWLKERGCTYTTEYIDKECHWTVVFPNQELRLLFKLTWGA